MNEDDNDNSTKFSDLMHMVLQSIEECDVPEYPREMQRAVEHCDSLLGAVSVLTDSTHTTSDCDDVKRKEQIIQEWALSPQAQFDVQNDDSDRRYPPLPMQNSIHLDGVIGTSYNDRWRQIRVVTLYLITITILFADMNLLAPNLSIIAEGMFAILFFKYLE